MPRVAELAEVGGLGDAELVIFVEAEDRAAAVGDADDAPALVARQEPARGGAAALVPGDGVIDARTVNVAPQDRVAAVLFGGVWTSMHRSVVLFQESPPYKVQGYSDQR